MTSSPNLLVVGKLIRWLIVLACVPVSSGQTVSHSVAEPPSFVVAEMGVRHELKPHYSTTTDWIDPGAALGRSYRCVLESGPDGLTLSEQGLLEWIPDSTGVGTSPFLEIEVQVVKDGQSIFEWNESFTLQVLAGLPELADLPPLVSYERSPNGTSGPMFSGYQPCDSDRGKFHWSLIDPPPGVTIDSEGWISWPDDRGYAAVEPYIFKLRIDYETPNGWLHDETERRHRILPQPASNNYGELRTYDLPPAPAGMLGYSLAAADGWIIAGEPFPDTSIPGRARLWKRNADNDTWGDDIALQSDIVIAGDDFGASISISPEDSAHPLRIAVGAPGSIRFRDSGETVVAVGAVHIYAANPEGTWQKESTIEAPLVQQSLKFGNAVAIEKDTLVSGMPGRNVAGYEAGALAIYRYDGSEWEWSQTLDAGDPAWGDRFGESAEIEDGWIAVAAPGDDGVADNAGAVHLFNNDFGSFVSRQKIHAPEPKVDGRFGERIVMSGEWLFVSSFREEENRGAVHVYNRAGGVWAFRQSLVSPFAETGSGFGMAMSVSQDVLAVSAPGYLLGSPEFDKSVYPWKGISLFRLSGDSWEWSRQVTESPDGAPGRHTWGYALAQIGPDGTVASIPDHSPSVNGKSQIEAGRLFLHRWPALLDDPFTEVLANLPAIDGRPAEADDDSNHNGIPNIIDWMMGSDPGAGPTSWVARVPASLKPFLRFDGINGDAELMIPRLVRGMNRTAFVEVSDNLSEWTIIEEARWGALEEVYFRGSDGSNYLTYFHPVRFPKNGDEVPADRFFRWGARER